MRSIVWFKTDLRLHDNETLIRAIEQSNEVIPVYCFDERHYQNSEFGFQKTGIFRIQFLLESLADLDKSLRSLGSGLIVARGNPAIELVSIAKQYEAKKVFAKKEVAYEENKREEEVEKELWKLHCSFFKFSTSTLYHAEDLPFPLKDIPEVFTTFRKSVERESSIRNVFPKPSSVRSPFIPPLRLPSLEELGGVPFPVSDARKVFPWKGGETEGLKRIKDYFFSTKAIAHYKDTRNLLLGKDYSSKFSSWLSLGCLSARQIHKELKKYEEEFEESESTYWMQFELLWRDYFRFMMKKHRQKFFLKNGIKGREFNWPEHSLSLQEKWVNGETGVDFVDANMRELKLTGFMSNRGRQNVASYFCHQLKLDWRYGAAYFEQQLIDYDVCSNWGNWAYIAGVGNDPKGTRVFNIEKQALEYDPEKTYRTLWLTKN